VNNSDMKRQFAAYFLIAPFVIGAVIYFAPLWVGIPAFVVGGALWLGVLCALVKG
jgi:hypothetical protein